MAPRKQERRGKKGTRQQFPVILICCQGTVTEPEYFQRYKQSLRAPSITIRKKSLDPKKLVKHALNLKKDGNYDEVYIVVDVDEYTDQQFEEAIKLCRGQTTGKNKIHMVISNPCFELWLYLHKNPFPQREVDGGKLTHVLTQKGFLHGESQKHVSRTFDCTDPSHALQEADKHPIGLDERGPNPSTSVPHLVRRIKSAAQQHRR